MKKIAIASGKGGTGKTTMATNLALSIARSKICAAYIDCDVEEPNGYIFLKPTIENTQEVTISVPKVDLNKCTGCGECGEICQYGAITTLKQNVITLEQLCHSCRGCSLVCPTGAISDKEKSIGQISTGRSDSLFFAEGKLNISDIHSPALIKRLKKLSVQADIVIMDCPPGTGCPAVEAVKGTDMLLLVTEPTPFGLHDLKLAVAMAQKLGLPFAVVLNRSNMGDEKARGFCIENNIDIIMELPDDRRIARAYSEGLIIPDVLCEYKKQFDNLAEKLIQ